VIESESNYETQREVLENEIRISWLLEILAICPELLAPSGGTGRREPCSCYWYSWNK